jgi:hypothetical protein
LQTLHKKTGKKIPGYLEAKMGAPFSAAPSGAVFFMSIVYIVGSAKLTRQIHFRKLL